MNVMTIGFQGVSNRADIIKFVVAVSRYFGSVIPESITKADMFVGRPGAEELLLEDESRTMVLPVDIGSPKVYACENETGGLTFMLAEEY